MERVPDKMEDFIDDFYSYDFTGILYDDERSDDSDIEIDLGSVDVVEEVDDEEEADKMKRVSNVVDKEITNKLIQQEAYCIDIDDDYIRFILKSNTNKIKYKQKLFSSLSEKADIKFRLWKVTKSWKHFVTFNRRNVWISEINNRPNFNQ